MKLAKIAGGNIYLPMTSVYKPAMAMPHVDVTADYGGSFVLPYTPEHVRMVNRACQTRLPGPAFAAWKYGGRFPPYMHQRETVDFLTQNRRCFVLNGMGTGKTSSAIWAAEFLLEAGQVKRVLILSPLSTLRTVWVNEVFALRPGRRVAVAHGSAAKRKQALEGDAVYVVTNHDAMRLADMKAETLAQLFDLVIVDEATVFKTWSSGGMPARYKNMLALARKVPRLWMLTGTPTPNSPMDAWAMIRLVDPAFTMSRLAFQNRTMVQVSEYRWLPKPDATDTVARLLQPSIRFNKSQVLASLPPKVFTSREVPLTKEQQEARTRLKKEAKLELKGKNITAANAAVLVSKMLQVAAGTVFDEEGAPVELDMGPRLAEIETLIQQAQGKVLIFSSFTETVQRIDRHLRQAGYRSANIYGATGLTRRTEIFEKFQKTDELDIISAHPGTMAHGLTLTEADLVIWATPVMSNELFEQANDRPHRPGQKRSVTIARIYGTPEEKKVFDRLESRGSVQSEVLDLVEEFVR